MGYLLRILSPQWTASFNGLTLVCDRSNSFFKTGINRCQNTVCPSWSLKFRLQVILSCWTSLMRYDTASSVIKGILTPNTWGYTNLWSLWWVKCCVCSGIVCMWSMPHSVPPLQCRLKTPYWKGVCTGNNIGTVSIWLEI